MQNKKAERAKIFLPFASLRGFQNYLLEKERVVVEKKELSLDECDLLNYQIYQIKVGDMVRVVHYDQGEYIETRGLVASLDLENGKFIKIVGTVIDVKNIIEIDMDNVLEK